MRPSRITFTFLLIVCAWSLCNAQWQEYQYRRPVEGVRDQWHFIQLPKNLYGRVRNDLSDVRILGISGQDTLEVPYVIDRPKAREEIVAFDIINQTRSGPGFYYTFDLRTDTTINYLELEFRTENFDWNITFEGSSDMKDWYTVLEDYRILSIKNSVTDYQFTRLNFPAARFRFFRLLVPATSDPKLESGIVARNTPESIVYDDYGDAIVKSSIDKDEKKTILDISVGQPGRISYLRLDIADSVDYYRPIEIKYLDDSMQTEKGWIHKYHSAYRGTLSSLEALEFEFSPQIAQRLQVSIADRDNMPLTITGAEVKGRSKRLLARFTGPATDYYMVYGNQFARPASYDIENFRSNIPQDLLGLVLGSEEELVKIETPGISPLFENRFWLWTIIFVIMAVLVWFSIRMLKSK